MQKWLMTIRSFNMLTNHKNKEARIVPGFFIFVKLFYLKDEPSPKKVADFKRKFPIIPQSQNLCDR